MTRKDPAEEPDYAELIASCLERENGLHLDPETHQILVTNVREYLESEVDRAIRGESTVEPKGLLNAET